MKEKETVDIVDDLNNCLNGFLYGVFIEGEDLELLKKVAQASFTLTHFLCTHVNPNMVLASAQIRSKLEESEDEDELRQLESEVSDVQQCLGFFSHLQDEMLEYSANKLGKTQAEIEAMAQIAECLVKDDNE